MARSAHVGLNLTMAIVPLTNDNWGFTTNCFVCESRNESGLRIPYFHDDDAQLVYAEFELDDRFSGAPTWAHGGVSLAICDEAMAWATIAIHHKWAVTKESAAAFDRPIVIGRRYRCEARIESATDESIATVATITAVESAKTCVRTTATMSVLSAVQAPSLGISLTGEHEDYLRP